MDVRSRHEGDTRSLGDLFRPLHDGLVPVDVRVMGDLEVEVRSEDALVPVSDVAGLLDVVSLEGH